MSIIKVYTRYILRTYHIVWGFQMCDSDKSVQAWRILMSSGTALCPAAKFKIWPCLGPELPVAYSDRFGRAGVIDYMIRQ